MNRMDITFLFIKYAKKLMEVKKISVGDIPEYAITHMPDKEVSRNHSELPCCASTFRVTCM